LKIGSESGREEEWNDPEGGGVVGQSNSDEFCEFGIIGVFSNIGNPFACSPPPPPPTSIQLFLLLEAVLGAVDLLSLLNLDSAVELLLLKFGVIGDQS